MAKASLLKAIEPTRLIILNQIKKFGHITPRELSSYVTMSDQALSQHLSILRKLRLVNVEKSGTSLIYSLNEEKITELHTIITKSLAGSFKITKKTSEEIRNE